MDASTIDTVAGLAETFTKLAEGLVSGKTAEDLNLAWELENVVATVAKVHLAAIGTPINPDAIKYEAPLDDSDRIV